MLKGKKMLLLLSMVLLLAVAVVGCGGTEKSNESKQSAEPKAEQKQEVALSAGGASFPFPLYSKWIDVYTKGNPNIKLDYQSIGSGGGIKGILAKTFDFAGSDAPMKDEDLAKASVEILHIPTVMGAVVVTYKIPGVTESIKLTSDTVADIFLGKITKWNDSRLTEINPDVKLPAKDIVVVHRSDGSGTTNTFTDYLTKVSSAWKDKVGKGTSVEWPIGLGAKGNEGVAGQISQTEGSIGYVELAYAVENKLPYAKLKNKAGNFVEASLDTTSEAAAGALANMPEDMRVSITDSPGANAWPMATFTYLLIYKNQDDPVKGKATLDFAWWAIHEGEGYAKDLLYAPLPTSLVEKLEGKLKSVTHNGEPILK
ncbi:MAG: phosphate ABC transporter substrate-binding protein PstS [Eubacteriales bacterium]